MSTRVSVASVKFKRFDGTEIELSVDEARSLWEELSKLFDGNVPLLAPAPYPLPILMPSPLPPAWWLSPWCDTSNPPPDMSRTTCEAAGASTVCIGLQQPSSPPHVLRG